MPLSRAVLAHFMKKLFKKHFQGHSQAGWHKIFRHPVMLAFAGLAVLLLLVFGGYRLMFAAGEEVSPGSAFIVIVRHDDQVETVPSRQQTVGQLLENMDIELNVGDVVEPEKTTVIAQDDFRINIYRAVPVKVVDGHKSEYTFSAASTPRAIVQQVGYEIYPEDGVEAEPVTNFLEQGAIGEVVRVEESFPVKLNLYGSNLTIRTHAGTVGEMLRDKGLKIAHSDQVLPGPSTPLEEGMGVVVARKGTKLRSIVEPIAMPTKTIDDNDLAYGTRAIRQHGQPGKRAVIYSIDKKTKDKKIVQTVVLQKPVEQIVAIGTNLSGTRGDVIRAGISAEDYFYVDYIVSRESNWNYRAYNESSGAYGLCQALPGSKMASAGSDWETNPITQLRWCDSYATERYGSWYGAYLFWVNNHWW